MLGLIFCSVGAFVGMTIFWTVPPAVLSTGARPVGIAFISTIGIVASSVSPLVIGFLKDLTHSWVASLMFVVVSLVAAAGLAMLVKTRERASISLVTPVVEAD
jgi:ACS family 4-hydroxyphenylacetate permease-like MFS transporter